MRMRQRTRLLRQEASQLFVEPLQRTPSLATFLHLHSCACPVHVSGSGPSPPRVLSLHVCAPFWAVRISQFVVRVRVSSCVNLQVNLAVRPRACPCRGDEQVAERELCISCMRDLTTAPGLSGCKSSVLLVVVLFFGVYPSATLHSPEACPAMTRVQSVASTISPLTVLVLRGGDDPAGEASDHAVEEQTASPGSLDFTVELQRLARSSTLARGRLSRLSVKRLTQLFRIRCPDDACAQKPDKSALIET